MKNIDLNLIGFSKNEYPVFDRPNSHLHTGCMKLLPTVLNNIDLTEDFIVYTHDFEFPIGKTYCVKTNVNDIIYYKQREGRIGNSRFVKNREPELTDKLTVILLLDKINKYYIVLTAFIGDKSEPEIWDLNSIEKNKNGFDYGMEAALQFWANNALIEE